ncbi:transposase [Trichonephila clavipes]|nr:transposase [Trichonephila clavipes]
MKYQRNGYRSYLLFVFPPIERAVILSDSTSALQALSNYNENNCLRVQNCRELLGKIKGKIVFQWVPSHCGLWGNERADFLAKKGTGILQNFRRDLTLHSAILEIKRIFRESFRLTAFRVARDKPWSTLCKKSHGIPSSPLAAAVAKFRLLTGHDCLCAHLFRFNLVTSPICVLCDTGQDMTAAHLDECSALNDLNCIVKSCQVIYSQFGLAIHQNDHQARRRFVEWAQNEIAVVPDFHKRILFIDEAHFWLNGYVNKQNCRIWSEANPQVYVETPLHPEKLTVWCALWAGGIIGPYFFKNDEGHNVTVNGDRYRAMITNFFIPELNNHDVQELWFQQDGATCHTALATIDLLKDTFGDRLISRFGPVNWPPRSCDLTPLDYFLWGYVKSLVYADKPQTRDHLEDNIRRVIADIRPQMLEKAIENWTSRLDYIRASRGSPMPEIIFKM